MTIHKLAGIAPLLLACGCVMSERVERIPACEPVSIESIVADLAAGAPEAQVVDEIALHGVLRVPSPDDVIALKRGGASDALVIAVLRAPVTTPRRAQTIVYRSVDVDWCAVGDITVGALRIAGEFAGAAFRFRCR